MTVVKTKDLTGHTLDYAVALCLGYGPGKYMRSFYATKI